MYQYCVILLIVVCSEQHGNAEDNTLRLEQQSLDSI
jgi:hypothetical protein